MIADETPTYDRERWEKILDLLIKKDLDLELLMETRVEDILRDKDIISKYREAGILHIYVGAESASQDTLNRYNKNQKVEQSKEAIDIINNQASFQRPHLSLGCRMIPRSPSRQL